MYLCVRISVLPCSAILIFDCGIVLYVLFLILLLIIGVVKTMICKALHRNLKIEQHKPFCPTRGTRRVTLVRNPMISQ
jgi:hypothetical protein